MNGSMPDGVVVTGPAVPASDRILTPEALAFVADLQRRFGSLRLDLLKRREERQAELDAGVRPDFLVPAVELFRELLLVHDATGPHHQHFEHAQLARREVERFSAECRAPPRRIQHQRPMT